MTIYIERNKISYYQENLDGSCEAIIDGVHVVWGIDCPELGPTKHYIKSLMQG